MRALDWTNAPSSIPLIRANPPRLSRMIAETEALERSGTFSNNGQQVRRFEAAATERLFGGIGGCVTVANATLGLMLALRQSRERAAQPNPLALMPSFTFAATAQAALWAGLRPVFCDIDPQSWVPCPRSEERQLKRHAGRIAAIVPYATFGNCIDLERYEWLAHRHDVDVVVDAAASLGSRNTEGRGFGTATRLAVVFSMHATKTFATAEGGLIYSADPDRLALLRRMANFGMDDDRSAIMPGLNAKMSELTAMLANKKLAGFEQIVAHRETLAARYRQALPGFAVQSRLGAVQAQQFMPILITPELRTHRPAILAALAAQGIGAAKYFSPHLAEQPYFRATCLRARVPVTNDIASRVIVLPLADRMTEAEVDTVCDALLEICAHHEAPAPAGNAPLRPQSPSRHAPSP